MMKLSDVKDWIEALETKFEYYYVGFLDRKKPKSLGVYQLNRNNKPLVSLGGIENTSYAIKKVSLLIHYTNASDGTEAIADQLYQEIMNAQPQKIGEHEVCFVGMLTGEPIDVGRDDNGICEYVIEFEIYYKK